MELWASGDFTASWKTEMIAKNVGATGACSAYMDFMTLDYDLFVESEDSGKQFGPSTEGEGSTNNGV